MIAPSVFRVVFVIITAFLENRVEQFLVHWLIGVGIECSLRTSRHHCRICRLFAFSLEPLGR